MIFLRQSIVWKWRWGIEAHKSWYYVSCEGFGRGRKGGGQASAPYSHNLKSDQLNRWSVCMYVHLSWANAILQLCIVKVQCNTLLQTPWELCILWQNFCSLAYNDLLQCTIMTCYSVLDNRSSGPATFFHRQSWTCIKVQFRVKMGFLHGFFFCLFLFF